MFIVGFSFCLCSTSRINLLIERTKSPPTSGLAPSPNVVSYALLRDLFTSCLYRNKNVETSGISFGCCCCCCSTLIQLFKSIYHIIEYVSGAHLVCMCMVSVWVRAAGICSCSGMMRLKRYYYIFSHFVLSLGVQNYPYRRHSSWRGSAGMRDIICTVH